MGKYRIWKYGGVISYKDVEANSLEEAGKSYTSPEQDWTVTSRGMIVDHFVTDDLENFDGDGLFLNRRVQDTQDRIDAIMNRGEWQESFDALTTQSTHKKTSRRNKV